MSLLIRNARVLLAFESPPGCALRGRAMGDWPVLMGADVLVEGGTISKVGRGLKPFRGAAEIDAAGRVLMPGFTDCHTHACWAGDRLDEWDQKRAGTPYLDILARGGGIMSTVRAVRAAAPALLAAMLRARLERMLALGSTTIEVKSGYGLSKAAEMKMLNAIAQGAVGFAGTVVLTALLGHAIDADAPDGEAFVRETIDSTLPAVSAKFPGIAVDAYCEQGAWGLDDCRVLFEIAMQRGHPIRVHADQFNSLGMIAINTEWSARGHAMRSIDHLEATPPADLGALAATPTIGVLLPCTGFHTDGRYADGRALVDAGGAAALATNNNPGTSPCPSMPMAIALAVRFNKLSVNEAIAAATINGAAALGLHDRGAIAPGMRADLLLLEHRDERMLAYEFGDNPVREAIVGGRLVRLSRANASF
ncbi:MAG: imidazolonepropionase [Phycisphaeraceae bacterium]|nr:imidazolonepropionase [Phycisphaeraceae bacterium]